MTRPASSARRRTSSSSRRDRDDPTTAWARDVVEGRIVAGDLCRRACERHLRDIVDAPARGLFWRPEIAARVLRFFPALLSVTDGAAEGQPFRLPSYSTFVVGSLFGWVRSDGKRRFRRAWIEAGKGSMKSPLMAAIGLYVMGWDGIRGSQVYAIAKDRMQSNVLFRDAVRMCRTTIPGHDEGVSLESEGKVIIRGTGEMSWMIEHPESGSKFVPLAGDANTSGPRPSMVCADEIHEWRSNAMIETWQAALDKMPGSPLMILGTNTPAADQIVGTEYSEQYQRILRREVDSRDSDAAFSIICRTDPDDKPMEDESCWQKSLPLLGITFPVENVRDRVKASRLSFATHLATQRLYFGIPVGTAEYWIDIDAWESVQGRVDPDEMRGHRCWLSMDLSRKNDLTALGMGWEVETEEGAKLHAAVKYWKPQDRLADAAREDAAPYVVWASAGLLNATPGKSIDYDFVAVEVQKICAAHEVEAMAFDPAHIDEFRKACGRIGFATWVWAPDQPPGDGLKMIVHSQGHAGMHSKKALWMPRSLGQLEDSILTGGIVIDESPVTKWCSGNAAVQPDAHGNRYFVKKRSRGRIDGLVALAMLSGIAAANAGAEETGSIYDDPERYAREFGRQNAEPMPTVTDWSPEILNDPRHPLFAQHKAAFERWQDMREDDL